MRGREINNEIELVSHSTPRQCGERRGLIVIRAWRQGLTGMLRESTISLVGFLPREAPWHPTTKLLPMGWRGGRRGERGEGEYETKEGISGKRDDNM